MPVALCTAQKERLQWYLLKPEPTHSPRSEGKKRSRQHHPGSPQQRKAPQEWLWRYVSTLPISTHSAEAVSIKRKQGRETETNEVRPHGLHCFLHVLRSDRFSEYVSHFVSARPPAIAPQPLCRHGVAGPSRAAPHHEGGAVRLEDDLAVQVPVAWAASLNPPPPPTRSHTHGPPLPHPQHLFSGEGMVHSVVQGTLCRCPHSAHDAPPPLLRHCCEFLGPHAV